MLNFTVAYFQFENPLVTRQNQHCLSTGVLHLNEHEHKYDRVTYPGLPHSVTNATWKTKMIGKIS